MHLYVAHKKLKYTHSKVNLKSITMLISLYNNDIQLIEL